MQITKHKHVTCNYSLAIDDGTIVASSDDGDPLEYVHGREDLLPKLEEALEGKGAGDQVELTVAPEDGYGPRDENLIHRVERSQFEPGADIQVGAQVTAMGPDGSFLMKVVGVADDVITLDANHPLAGATLKFNVEVLAVRDATPDELGSN